MTTAMTPKINAGITVWPKSSVGTDLAKQTEAYLNWRAEKIAEAVRQQALDGRPIVMKVIKE